MSYVKDINGSLVEYLDDVVCLDTMDHNYIDSLSCLMILAL